MHVQQDDKPTFEGMADPVGPFGNPDGSRASIENVLSHFVDFRGNPAFGALATPPDDATSRVIVGRLGAGKTVYLRRLRDFQARRESVYADHPQQNLPSTEAIVKACRWFPEQEFDCTTSFPSVLWQNGLLGYVEADGEARFYSHAEMDQFDIPMDADNYVFHPCVIDSVRIRGIGDPVYPFGRRRP